MADSSYLDSTLWRYTAFPNLHHIVDRTHLTGLSECSFELPASVVVTRETVILAWAILLRGYTRSDNVVFGLDDGGVVGVDFDKDRVEEYANGEHAESRGEKMTEICFTSDKTPPRPIQLFLQVDIEGKKAYLAASEDAVPQKHLRNIVSQFYHIVTCVPTGPNQRVPPFPTEPIQVPYVNCGVSPDDCPPLSALNTHPVQLDGPSLLHDLIQHEHCGLDGGNAIEFLNADGTKTKLSYERLHSLSDGLARRIADVLERSTGRKTVPVLLPQSPELYVALLAILKAGAAFVPLHLDAPEERIRFVVGDVGAGAIITTADLGGMFDGPGMPELIITDDGSLESSNENVPVFSPATVSPTDAAYIMYTSGSTGKPKGVTISHAAASQSLLAHDRHIPPFQRFLQFAAPTFDVSVFDTFFPLFRGCTLIGCDRARLLADLPAAINSLAVDAAELTPTVAGGLLINRAAVPGLKVLLTIGEMLTRPVISSFGGGVLHGMYGPTEAAIHCTVATDFATTSKIGDIGVPLDTVSAFVLAAETEDVEVLPLGWMGELAVGGWQLADGYLNRPDLTSAAFVNCSRWGRLYRTGDRARILPSGRIECLGRISEGQVKLRGQRVELGEVEEVILKSPDIQMAIASVVDGSLVVYVSAPGEGADKMAVKQVCRQWLPGFMIPSDVVIYEHLPRLPSGKVDRKRLDKEYSERSSKNLNDEGEESLSAPEEAVARTVEMLLGRRPRREDSLVSLGLDSMQAIRLASRLRASGLGVEVVDIVKLDTVTGIASRAVPLSGSDSSVRSERYGAVHEAGLIEVPISLRDDVEDIIPCTSLQESMIAETAKNASAYCNWILLELLFTTPAVVVEAAFRAIVERHEILRTGFVGINGGFAQVVWKTARKGQFGLADAMELNWEVSLGDLLEPPFSAALMIGANGDKKLGIRIHHALYDGWSWDHIMSDFQRLLAGQQLAPGPRPQYRNVVDWELSRSDESIRLAQQFWKSKLDGASETRLPSFHGHSSVQPGVSVQGLNSTVSLSQLEHSARSTGVSAQAFVQSAWACILSSYVGNEDVVFGTVTSGRTIPVDGIEDIIGPTILTLPIRVNTTLRKDVRTLLREVQEFNVGVMEHPELGLREVRKVCGSDGWFDSLIAWQQNATERQGGGLRMVESKDKLEFSLLIEVEPTDNNILLRATYKDEIFPAEQVSLLLQQMDCFIRGMVTHPDRSVKALIADLPLNGRVLSIANPYPTLTPQPSTRTLSTMFEESTARHSSALALEMVSDILDGRATTKTLTYSELNSAANKLARELVLRGTLPDELVAICMEKSINCYFSILATVKAGAGYLPLTPETPVERVRQILKNAETKILLATRDVIERLGPMEGLNMVDIDTLNLSAHSSENLGIETSSKTLAYAVFTSGSTGVPKGVLVEHEQAVSNLDVLAEIYPTAVGKRMLQFCNIAFDVSVFEIFFAWHRGMVLCSATKDVLLRDMETAVNAMQVTHLSMTPTVAALLKPDNVPSVEFLVTSGEAVTKKVFYEWAGRGLYQGYGPSETTNVCTANPRVQRTHDISNIGPPFVNTSTFVVAADQEDLLLLPRGAVGELAFGGEQVCRGYLKMEELTVAKFVTHPEFGRVYRSGDMGRLLSSDEIVFVARKDDQVKIRGNRIELGEINSVLLRDTDAISDAVTLVVAKDGGPMLVAFVVPDEHKRTEFEVVGGDKVKGTITTLFQRLVAFVPAYMVPTAIVSVSTIPMTVQGKTDKKLLERTFMELDGALLDTFSASGGDATGDWTEAERAIADIIAQVSHAEINTVGRHTSIFTLGLDSISAITLSRKFQSAGFERLDVTKIMMNHTVSALARVLGQEQGRRDVPNSEHSGAAALEEFSTSVREEVLGQLSYPTDQIVKILPCTPLQESTLSIKKDADPRDYYNHTVLSLNADPRRLEEAWNIVAEAHEILRTCFALTIHHKHAFAQIVVREHPVAWSERSYSSDDDVAIAIEDHISAVGESLDLTRPPYTFGVFKSPTKSTLVMSFHHSLYDGFAMELLLEDVQRAYARAELPVRAPFDSYLQYMESLDLLRADEFWKKQLSGLLPSSFPDLTGASNSARKQLEGMASRRVSCSRDLATINSACRGFSASLLSLGQSTWARLLAAYTGDADICFGTVVSGRTIPVDGVESIVAPCFNTVPVRVQVTGGATTREVMMELQDGNANSMAFQLTPLRRIMNALGTEGGRLFDTLFILQRGRESIADMWEVVEERGKMDFSIVAELAPSPAKNELEIIMHYRRDMILDEHIDVLLQQFDQTMISALDNAESKALDFSFLPASIISQANLRPNVLQSAGGGLLHSEFERNAQEQPDRIALQYLEDGGSLTSLTFGQLNDRANFIANHILSLDVSREEAIPLSIPKSPLYYICVLAVLKAGCAFTPIDHSLPVKRREFMITELQARIVLGVANDLVGVQIVDVEQLLSSYDASIGTSNPVIPDLTPRSLAYRIYTSGSTGLPKAVSIEHHNAVQTFLASKHLIRWEPSSRLLQFAATTFDMCYYDIFMAWSYGFTLCSAAPKYLLGELAATIQRLQITMLDLTPTVACTLSAGDLPDVELLYCIGEAMPQKLADEWEGRCVNSYGPTEAAMCCTITPVSRKIKASNIGRPFETTMFVVLHRSGTGTIPLFGSGELCIGGPQVAREYHNNPSLTSTRFINFRGETLYRTGDIVRQLADGTFEFIGRADDQIKIRGLRVELDEINAVLGRHESVKDVATLVLRHGAEGKEQLVAFLAMGGRKQHGSAPPVVQAACEELVAEVRKYAQSMLPRYMIPTVILVVAHIPLSAAGKIDKRALGELFHAQDIAAFSHSHDRESEVWSEKELKIRMVLAHISKVPEEQIGKATTIYEIGLDSISTAQVARGLARAGLKVEVLDILERPSIELLADVVLDKTGETEINKKSGLVHDFQSKFLPIILAERSLDTATVAGVFPCTAVQEGMLSQFLRSHGELYFNHTLMKLPIDCDEKKLRAAWNSVFMACDILRSGFVEVDDDVHTFAAVTYQRGSIELPWHSVESVADVHVFVEKEKKAAGEAVVKSLQLPPWQLLFFNSVSAGSYLLFSGHHALYDATSLQIIFGNVSAGYNGSEVSENLHFLPTLETILAHSLDPSTVEKDRIFWQKQLEGSSITRLPNLCPLRNTATTYHIRELSISTKLSSLEATCQTLGITLHSAGQAAWARVLSAYTGEAAPTVGVVLSGRTGLSADGAVFPCLVTIPSLCNLQDKSNLQLAREIQAFNMRSLKHQYAPLKSLQRWLEHPEESFFDSIFVYQKTEEDENELPWEVVAEDAAVDYTFSLEIEPKLKEDHLLIRATARDSHIPMQQTKLLIRQFEEVLLDLLRNPEGSSTDHSYMSTELLSITPAKVAEIPGEVSLLHDFVQRWASDHPNDPALEFVTSIDDSSIAKQTWTYSEFDCQGNKIANLIVSMGIAAGSIIGICFDKSPAASFAILGILKAGCAYVAIDPTAPIDRKAYIVKDSNAAAVFTLDIYRSELQNAMGVPVVSADSDSRIAAISSSAPLVSEVTGESLCYCLYTSGTTGLPKGCLLTHTNAVQAMYAFQRLFTPHWDSSSRWLQFASFHFDVSVLEQFWSWSVGICVVSAPRDVIFQDLPGTIKRLRITHLDLTPSLAGLLRPEECPELCRGVFITGGEALKQDILDVWGETGVIYNGYGPTEVTIGMTMYPRVPANGKPSNIGPQFDNVGTYVLQPGTFTPVPRGAVGELCASGKLVGRGYLNCPELTEKAFPMLGGEKIYRTGDLVRILHDGCFDFQGRKDDQVKLRGQRLEIGEINEVVKKADQSVEVVATLVLKHPKQQKDQLVSFFIVRGQDGATVKPMICYDGDRAALISTLVDACRKKLPTYMVPTHFLPLSHMPLSINNKVDNKALKALYLDTTLETLQQLARRGEDANDNAWTDSERRLRTVLAEMTKLETSEIKRSSTVFELGLDSVSVVGLARRLKRNGFAAATPSLIMQNPSVSQIAGALSQAGGAGADGEFARLEATKQRIAAFANKNSFGITERLKLQSEDIERVMPCTPLQEGMIARFLDSGTSLYYNSFPMVLGAQTDLGKLHEAWKAVVKTTDILRTCFCETPDGYAQIVLKQPSLNWEETTIQTEDFQDAASNGLMMSFARNRTLYLPPFSIQCIRTPTRCVISLNIFHALYDGNSLPLILEDVRSLYLGTFTPRSSQFTDVIAHILSIDLGTAREFWKEHVKPSKPLDLDQLRGKVGKQTSMDHTEELTLNLGTDGLDKLCGQIQCTPQSIFQAAWASALSPYCGPAVTLGLVVSGRSLPLDNIEGVIGPTFNTIPATFDVAGATSWNALIGAIHRFNSTSMPYHHTPLRLIQKWMRRTKEPLFETLFVYQKDTGSDEEEEELWEIVPGKTMADYLLALEAVQSAKGIVKLTVVAKAELAQENVVGLLQSVAENLRNILADPERNPLTTTPSPNGTQEDADHVGHSGPDSGEEIFEWSAQAKVMRKIISGLAEVAESEVSADSSILELGLDSIEAIKLSSRLRQEGIEISVSNIMRNATIRKMLKSLDDVAAAGPSASTNTLAEFERAVRRKMPGLGAGSVVYPTTPLQEAMIAETLASGYTRYFNHDVLKLEEWVDINRLEAAWSAATKSNDILRTSFISTEGSDVRQAYAQVVHASADFSCHWEELRVPTEDCVQKAIDATMDRVTGSADLLAEPPVYVTILKAPESAHMVLSMSHALYDGWSVGLLHEDLRRAYFHADISRPSPRLMIEKIVDTNLEESKRFWSQKLYGAIPSSLPTSAFSPTAQTKRAEKISSVSLTEARAFCKQIGATLQALGQTCWALMLAYYLGETDVVFGSVLSGRDYDGADEVMFPAMNTAPVRTILHGSYADLLAYVQENGAETLRHQHTPLREIQRLVRGEGARLFDTLFLSQRSQESGDGGESLYRSVGGSSDVEYNIAVEMERSGDTITWRSACKSVSEEGSYLLELLDSLLAHVVQNPEHPVITYAENGLVFGNLPVVPRRSQPVLNGMRVDLDEVADSLRDASSEVDECAVIVASDAGRDVLVAFLAGSQAASAIPKVISAANKVLPYWSVPSYAVATDSIPFAGPKVDREALHVRFEALANRQQYAIEQQTGEWSLLERKIRTVLSKVSGLPEDEIQRTQTIFHLGLDSISAIRLASDLRKENIRLNVADILREATIERMATSLSEVKTNGTAAAPSIDSTAVIRKSLAELDMFKCLHDIPPAQIEAVYPATAGQLYMLEAWESSNRTIFMPTFTFRTARINHSQIRHAWKVLVEQEAILRTIFRPTGNEEVPFVQVVLRAPPPDFDWSETSQPLDPVFLRFIKAREQKKVPDMNLPAVRLYYNNTPTETILFLTIHHALYDGVSLPMLLTRLGSLLKQRPGETRMQTPEPEGPKFLQYVALTQIQNTNKQREFWTEYLHGAKSTLVQKRRTAQTTSRSSVYRPGAIRNASSVELYCRKEGISVHAVFLAAFARVLSQRIGAADEIIIGVYFANRNIFGPELSGMASPTLNIVPLRVRGLATSSLTDLVRNIQMDLIAIGNVQNAVVDLKRIQRWTGVEVDVFFNFLKTHDHEGMSSASAGGGGVVLEELEIEEEEEEVGSEVQIRGRPGAVMRMYQSFLHDFLGRFFAAAVALKVVRYWWWVLGLRSKLRRRRSMTSSSVSTNIRTNLDFEVAVRNGSVDVGAFSCVAGACDGLVEEVVGVVRGLGRAIR